MGKSPSNEADQVNSNQLVRPTPVNIESSFHYNELFFRLLIINLLYNLRTMFFYE